MHYYYYQPYQPLFLYSTTRNMDPDIKSHFFVTQFQTLFLAIIITGSMQFSNHLAVYLVYCCPIYFAVVIMQYYAVWSQKIEVTTIFNVCNVGMFIISFPIFFGVFFGIFHPTASLEFKQVENCQLIGSLNDNIENFENYAILYVNFEYEGQQYLGAACSSDQSQGLTTNIIYPYKFYYKYDTFTCNKDDSDNTDMNDSRLLEEISNNTRNRFLNGNGSQRNTGSCARYYLWSKVKIASWLCLQRGFDVGQYMEKQTCYVHFLSGAEAVNSGRERQPMKDQNDFPLISYSPNAYFPKADLICLIIFTYYFWILSFNSIFQYTANIILRNMRKLKLRKEYIASIQSPKNEDTPQIQKHIKKQNDK